MASHQKGFIACFSESVLKWMQKYVLLFSFLFFVSCLDVPSYVNLTHWIKCEWEWFMRAIQKKRKLWDHTGSTCTCTCTCMYYNNSLTKSHNWILNACKTRKCSNYTHTHTHTHTYTISLLYTSTYTSWQG